jgi:hypothetical protein
MNNSQNDIFKFQSWLLALLPDLRWLEIIGNLWRVARNVVRGLTSEGIYEVLEYECGIELKDKEGTKAKIHKRERVRYLQDYVTTFQDEAWGNGDFLLNYKCSPGIPVDQYQLGHNTYKLISLREFRNKGDVDEFNIEWDMRNGFLKPTGFWGTAINRRTKRIKIVVVFPVDRPPLRFSVFEKNLQRTHLLTADIQKKLPDGRQAIIWEKDNPRLYEDYILSWEW